MEYFIGIDPGKSGAIAVITKDKQIVELASFSKEEYLRILRHYGELDSVCCLEHVASMPGQGVASTFAFGENFGWIQGVMEAMHCSYQLVRPRVWKKDFSLNDSKQLSTEACRRLFPDAGDRLHKTPKSKKDDDGLAEALLMAEYARRRL